MPTISQNVLQKPIGNFGKITQSGLRSMGKIDESFSNYILFALKRKYKLEIKGKFINKKGISIKYFHNFY